MKMHEIMDLAQKIEERYGKMLSLDKVAEYLGIDLSTVAVLVKSGEMDAVEIRGLYMVKSVQLAKFELDITKMPGTSSPVTKESEVNIMKVTEGSIYSVKSNKNPYEMRFFITFDDGVKRAVKVRGAGEEELMRKKQEKILEVLEEYRSEKNGTAGVRMKPAIPEKHTFREVSELWFKEFEMESRSKGNSYSNHESAKYSLKAVNAVIGEMDIREIDKATAQKMIDAVSVDGEGNYRSKSHVEKAMRKFRKVMEYALEQGYIDRQIGILYLNKNLTEPDKDSRFIKEEVLKELLQCIAKNPFYNTLMNLMLSSGLRQEEALALTIDDLRGHNDLYRVNVNKVVVESASNKYVIKNKLKNNERGRCVPVSEEVYAMLKEYYYNNIKKSQMMKLRKEHGTEKYIFVNKNGCIYNTRTLYRSMKGYLSRNMDNGDNVTLHMFRHTFASYMRDEISLEEISEILGHKDISITLKFYASQTEEEHKRAGAGVEAMMKKLKGQGR